MTAVCTDITHIQSKKREKNWSFSTHNVPIQVEQLMSESLADDVSVIKNTLISYLWKSQPYNDNSIM